FRSMAAAGILAFCANAYAADPASIPRQETPPAIASSEPGRSVMLHFDGSERISVDGSGRLEVIHGDFTIRRYRPALFQTIDGKRKTVRYSYHVVDSDHVQLKPIHPDPSAPVELAPVRAVGRNS
ncbi:MAG TPA: hypothetical protein VG345_12590, partial [Bryobacteraceae bacterium]|nr:hypothetical protein [Bryobacteraceae bacterium]